MNFVILNDSVINHLFGTGDFGRGTVHLATDIWSLLYYSYVGVFGLILLLIIHSFLLIHRDKILIFFSAIIFLTAFKEPHFLEVYGQFMFYYYTIIMNKKVVLLPVNNNKLNDLKYSI